MRETHLVCCGMVVPEAAGKYGCANCGGDNVAVRETAMYGNYGAGAKVRSGQRTGKLICYFTCPTRGGKDVLWATIVWDNEDIPEVRRARTLEVKPTGGGRWSSKWP